MDGIFVRGTEDDEGSDDGRQVSALFARKPARVVTVAMANRAARAIWAIMVRGEVYRMPVASPTAA